jgi:anti-sigma regulatory factor (Ser/Thr protein kinase)
VREPTDLAEARRVASRIAEDSGLGSIETANVALAATELASNLLKHAKSGRLLVRRLENDAATGLELSAVDRGPGIANVAQCMRDGYSTAGSAGTGLGAVKRLAQQFDIFSSPGQGSTVLAQFWAGARSEPPRTGLQFGAVCLPIAGETVCGDAWDVDCARGKCTCVVVDGLGHGPIAAQAAKAALVSVREHRGKPPAEIVERVHGALRSTRGAAFAVAEIDAAKGLIRFCGVGNISARVQSADKCRHMVSQNGIVGQDTRKLNEFTYPWTSDALLIMHSDGLTARWDLNEYAALGRRHPALIAGVLFRDFARGRDDATVLVARQDRDRM